MDHVGDKVRQLPEYRFDAFVRTRKPHYFAQRVTQILGAVKREADKANLLPPIRGAGERQEAPEGGWNGKCCSFNCGIARDRLAFPRNQPRAGHSRKRRNINTNTDITSVRDADTNTSTPFEKPSV